MNKIYDEYVAKYHEAIRHPKKYVVKQDVWITMRYLTDVNVEPFEKERINKVLNELKEQQESKLINAIVDTVESFQAYIATKRMYDSSTKGKTYYIDRSIKCNK